MQLIRFTSGETYTFFAPRWEYYICETEVDFGVGRLLNEILWQERKILEKFPVFEDDWGTKLGPNSLTSRSNKYNLLKWEVSQPLKRFISITHDQFISQFDLPPTAIYAQAWANVMRRGEKMAMHAHGRDPWCYLSGHLCVQVKETNTYYQNPYGGDPYASANAPGKLTLFPSWLPHFTDEVDSGDRVTVAFDIRTEEGYHKDIKDDMKEHWVKV